MDESSGLPIHRILAWLAFALCICALVDGLIPQLQMTLLGGQAPVTSTFTRAAVLAIPMFACLIHPRIDFANLPMATWLACIGYLIADMPHLLFARGIPLTDLLLSYGEYYLLLLIGPALFIFKGSVSARIIVRSTAILLVVCATIGIAQYLTGQPILRTESTDGKFEIYSWNFLGDVRAFSLFTSGLSFGLFCALCGALGIGLFRKSRWKGAFLFTAAALACFSTLTRVCYLVFFCTSIYALVLTFGKKSKRGIWQPILFFALGIATILSGLSSSLSGNATNLQDSSSLILRLEEWNYYAGTLSSASPTDALFGLGTTLNKENTIPIDNVPLALALHIGIVGLIVFTVLLFKMWLYLRREAIATQHPFVIAAASFWAALPCAGMFNIVLVQLGAVFALAILCDSGFVRLRNIPVLPSQQA
jgi:hypothetical protein